MARSVAVIVFIAIVAATGIYFWQRPTVARGDVIADDLLKSNPNLKSMTCDEHIPIGVDGATFHCGIELHNGSAGRVKLVYDRNGAITEAPSQQHDATPPIEKTSDPWGD